MDSQQQDAGEDFPILIEVINPRKELVDAVSAALTGSMQELTLWLAGGYFVSGTITWAQPRPKRKEARIRLLDQGGNPILVFIPHDATQPITAKMRPGAF